MIENPLSYLALFIIAVIVFVVVVKHYNAENPAREQTKEVVINSMSVNLDWGMTKKNKKGY